MEDSERSKEAPFTKRLFRTPVWELRKQSKRIWNNSRIFRARFEKFGKNAFFWKKIVFLKKNKTRIKPFRSDVFAAKRTMTKHVLRFFFIFLSFFFFKFKKRSFSIIKALVFSKHMTHDDLMFFFSKININ